MTRTLQVGVKVLLEEGQGRYLLIHRSPEAYPEVATPWDIPGGRIEVGSPLLENLRREVAEETGLEVVGQPKLIDAQDILRVPERHVVRLTYLARAKGEPRLSQDHTDYRWATADEIRGIQGMDDFLLHTLDTLAGQHD